MNDTHPLPRTVDCNGAPVELSLMGPADRDAVLAFARSLPPHDLLFLRRDITQARVVDAWLRSIEKGAITSVLARLKGELVGCMALVRDPLSWSPHLAELRVLLSAGARGRGLGVLLAQEGLVLGLRAGCEKLYAQMTVDQQAAIAIFEGLGFAPEALLRDHVKDRHSQTHDVVLLGHHVARMQARLHAYGVDEPA
jgi:RimJ/RimL family protein N-acetyltransferase